MSHKIHIFISEKSILFRFLIIDSKKSRFFLLLCVHRFVKLHVELPVNVIRIEAPQKAECYRFNVAVCDIVT